MRRRAYALLFLFPRLLYAQDKQQAHIDSLAGQLSEARNDTNKVKQLDLISFACSTVDPDKGIRYANEAKKLSEELGWKKGVARANSDLGINYKEKSDYEKALEYDRLALEQYRLLGMKSSMAGVLANMSLVCLAKSDYPEALKNAFEAEKICEELPDKITLAAIKEDIAIIYMDQHEFGKASQYFSVALQLQKKNKNKAGIARISGNLGIIEDARGNYSKALEYYMMAMTSNEESGNKNSTQINLANIGNAYLHLKNYSPALVNHFRALRISEELGMKQSIAVNKGNIGEDYFFIAKDTATSLIPDSLVKNTREANLQQAIIYLDEAKKACAEIGYFAPMIEFAGYLSEAYYLSGDYKNAFDTFRQNKKISDSIFSAQDELKIKSLETRRALELKDKEIAISNLKAEKNRDENYLLLAGIVLLLMATGLVVRALIRRNAKHKIILSDIASIQSHELRAPVARILGLAKLFNIKEPEDPVNKQLMGYIEEASIELDVIIRKVVDKTVE